MPTVYVKAQGVWQGVTSDGVTDPVLFAEQTSCPSSPSMWVAFLGMATLVLHGVPLGIPLHCLGPDQTEDSWVTPQLQGPTE